MSVNEESEALKNILFSAHLFLPIKMQSFLEVSANFHSNWRWHGSASCTYSNSNSCLNTGQSFTASPVNIKDLNDFIPSQSFNLPFPMML